MCRQFFIAQCLHDFLKKIILIALQFQANYPLLSHITFSPFFFKQVATSLAFPINQQKHWVKVSPCHARQSHISAMWLYWDNILPPSA